MHLKTLLAPALFSLGLTLPQAKAEEAPDNAAVSAPAANCSEEGSPWRDFDFWVGEWEVYDPDSAQKYGENDVEQLENRCLLLERWRSVDGTTGTSMNFVDPFSGQWRQVWQNAGVFIDMQGGRDDDGRMVLEGTVYYHGSGQTAPFRGRWTPTPDGSVLQEFWQQDAATGAWKPWFAGSYRRPGAQDG